MPNLNCARRSSWAAPISCAARGGARLRLGPRRPRTEGNLPRFPSVTSFPPITQTASSCSLQRPVVVEVGLHVAGEHREALDQLRDALQAQEREADRQEDLDRPADEAA